MQGTAPAAPQTAVATARPQVAAVVVARGRVRVKKAGPAKIRVQWTAKGKRLLRKRGGGTISFDATFAGPAAGSTRADVNVGP